jgi:putative effector of murein hydrolase
MIDALLRVRGLLGTPSITLVVLLADLLLHRRLFTTPERRALLAAVAVVSVVLYGSALGYLPFDVYRAGFSIWAPVVLATLAIVVARRSFAIACTLAAVLIAFAIPLYASLNLFDYAVDPILGLIAIGVTLWRRRLGGWPGGVPPPVRRLVHCCACATLEPNPTSNEFPSSVNELQS